MMAAEIRDSTIVEAAAISDSNATAKINDQPNDVDSSTPSLKGPDSSTSPDELANKHIADIVDDLVNSAEPSISGGSDTETSRLDALRGKNGDNGHARASSAARKPAVFKAVSVNKTFLAAKATVPGAAKPGEKASPTLGVATLSSSTSASARPRLIAKTGGGLVAKGSGGTNGRPAAAPDANAVWNKNRPVPVPEPAKLTDEELKKYGIHVASRLQQDDAKGEANWADIDDDDDDWAPEEIRWTDGTKSTIPHHDEHSLASPQPAMSELAVRPSSSQLHPQPTPVALLVKEAAPVEKPKSPAPVSDTPFTKPSGLPSGKGLILKGAQERPTLVAKPPAPPTPVKSPWAALPPIDKAPPVVMELPHGANVARMQHHQPYQPHQQRENYGPPPSTTTPPPFKEIAADDFSRGGFRDGHPHGNRELFNSQSGRLEPVQDRRGGVRGDVHYRQTPGTMLLQRPSQMSDQPEPSAAFQTHRGSMQDAGPYGRRRGSSNVSGGSGFLQRLSRTGDQGPDLLSARQPSVTGESDSPASPRNFSPSGSRSWQSRPSPRLAFAAPYSNAPAESLPSAQPTVQGPPPLVVTGSLDDEIEMQKKIMRERRELAMKRRLEEEEREEAARRERIRLKLEALGPAPERKSAKKEAAKEDTTSSVVTPASGAPPEPKHNASRDAAGDNAQSSHATNDSNAASPGTKRQQQSWQSPAAPPSDRLSSWGSGGQAPSRNLWAAPSSNRSLGNGTSFVTEPYAPAVSQITSKQGPGPIGPPASQKNAGPPAITPIGPPKTATATGAAAAAPTVAQPAGPPSSASSARSAWTSAVKAGDEDLLTQQKTRRAEQQREAEARGMSLNDLRPSIKDTWLPTRLNEDGDRIEDKNKRSVVHRAGNTAAPPVGSSAALPPQQPRPSRFFPPRDARSDDVSTGSGATAMGAGGGRHGRPGSPSPPPPDMAGHPVYDGDAAHPLVSLPRPSIVVRLPPEDKAAGAETAQPATTRNGQHVQHGSHAGPSQSSQWKQHSPVAKDDSSWQARFDNLFDRKATSPSKPSMGRNTGADSIPRGPAAETIAASQRRPAAALPKTPLGGSDAKPVPEEPINSRSMAEECFERQEMGSLPLVHLPHKAPELAWTPAAAPKPLPRRFLLSATTRVDHDTFLKDSFGAPYAVSIRMPGVSGSAKEVRLPMPRTPSNSRRSNHGRSGRSSRGTNRGGRDAAPTHPGSHNNDQSQPANANTNVNANANHGPPVGRSRGGGLRHRSDNWTRNSSAPVQT
ncbi:hypothetical protein CMQ_1582 [Grosmannia clavigera kw1407]|uniref:Uncharacterized protein n=1 Tax=Grosmannia clavigera (strain kw1407 / UAMH 11150) TaxID=655863 RepID=F0XER5_GROCL|nr:uncharacterized protein CMQ_1582 [Grosmannia clavigera kw1407]EFX04654.1 hypothetical protein CMQ_1582 [Grosmannia clavigera kw1407]